MILSSNQYQCIRQLAKWRLFLMVVFLSSLQTFINAKLKMKSKSGGKVCWSFSMMIPFSLIHTISAAMIWNTFHVKFTIFAKEIKWDRHAERERETKSEPTTASLVKQFSGHAYSASFLFQKRPTHSRIEWITWWKLLLLPLPLPPLLLLEIFIKNSMLYYITLDSYNLCACLWNKS